ncbi:hypothetical protein ABZP36_000069 [Zizania latifolia]
MKNLKVVTRIVQKLQLYGETIVVSAVDAERHRAFFASSENFIYAVDLPVPAQSDPAGEINSPSGQIQSSISWRGDGKFFATVGGPDGNSQKLTIWECESGKMHSSSDNKAFVEASLDWMPSGAKVATAHDRKIEGKCPLIVFYEKNGLERSYFSIDEPAEVAIQALKWNCNSELCSSFLWPVITHRFAWTTAVSETSIALVIDGSHVLVTPLSLGLMPPPMSLFHLSFPCAVNEVSFVSNNSKNHIAAYLSNGSLCVLALPMVDTWEEFEGSGISVDPCFSELTLNNYMHLTWIDTHTLIGVCCHSDACSSTPMMSSEASNLPEKHDSPFFINEIELVCSQDSLLALVCSSGWQARISKKMPLQYPVIGVSRNPAKEGSAFIQLSGGRIVEYCSKVNLFRMSAPVQVGEVGFDYSFAPSCPWMAAVPCYENGIVRPLLIGLDDSSKLHVGKRLLSNNCSSFTFYSSAYGATEQVVTHLLVTTKLGLLFIVDINEIFLKNGQVTTDSYIRSHPRGKQSKEHITVWEKGAKLIAVLHGDEAAVIMQTTRGNLSVSTLGSWSLFQLFRHLFRDVIEMQWTWADDARRKLYPSAEESLKHLLWLTDPEAVFNAALALYDLNLAAIVALNSQKDPKEFIPFLKSLECLPPAIMKYTVDLRLGKYESALRNIVSAGNEYHEDCMKLLNANPQLFPLGLQLFTDPDKRHQILAAWGDQLSEEKCFRDAAITYQCCSSYQKSLKAYRACGDWRGVFAVAGLLKLTKEENLQLAHELCDEFQALGKPGDAARIALDYCSDVDRGLSSSFMDVEDDNISEVSTSFSEMSAYTTRSTKESSASVISSRASKSRGARRQKKGGKIRAGSPGEEMALVEHLKGMSLTSGALNELKSLLVVLIQLGKGETARQVQLAGDNFEDSYKVTKYPQEEKLPQKKVYKAPVLLN